MRSLQKLLATLSPTGQAPAQTLTVLPSTARHINCFSASAMDVFSPFHDQNPWGHLPGADSWTPGGTE